MKMMNSYESDTHLISFADVQYVEKVKGGSAWVIMAGTTWNPEADCYNNAAWLSRPEVQGFIDQYNAFLDSRNEVIITGVIDTLKPEQPNETVN